MASVRALSGRKWLRIAVAGVIYSAAVGMALSLLWLLVMEVAHGFPA